MAAKKQFAFKAVERAVERARAQGIRIVRQPLFDWTGPDKTKPKACDATGAVLIQMGYGASSFTYAGKTTTYGTGEVRPKGWVLEIQEHLGVGVFWLWCFWMGWDYGNQIQVAETNDNGDIIGWKDEEVSRQAIKMAKRLCR